MAEKSQQPRKRGPGRPFKPGQCANPGGRPGVPKDVREAARELSTRAMQKLGEWMESDNPRASVAASMAILERAWGKPVQPIDGDGEGGPMRMVLSWERGE